MASAAESVTRPLVQPGLRLFTAADLAAMPEHLPSGDVSFELHHGRLVPMSPPGATHGNLQVRIGAELISQGEKKGYGKAFTEVGVVLARNPDHIVGADAAFVTSDSLPARESPEGYLETIPELVVEVRSKNDTAAEVSGKVADYLQAGSKSVWVVDDASATVAEYRPNSPPRVYRKSDTLTCNDLIPGFRLGLDDLFRA